MIKGILIVNNYGKPRLVKFYQSVVRFSINAFFECFMFTLLIVHRRMRMNSKV